MRESFTIRFTIIRYANAADAINRYQLYYRARAPVLTVI